MADTTLDSDRRAIRQVVDDWVLWRDSAEWDRFLTVWHDGAWMSATWFQGSAVEFVAASRAGFERGVHILHTLGGWSCDVAAPRAISQCRMTIHQRARLDGSLVDVACIGRFYDFFEKRDGRWGIVRRQPIYEKDRVDPVDPSVRLALDAELLAQFGEGYRHLAYVQAKNGFTVRTGLPGLRGPAVEKLYAEGRAWLAGASSPWADRD